MAPVVGTTSNPRESGVTGESDAGDGVFGLSKAQDRSGVTGFNQGGGRGLTAVGTPAGHFDGDVEVTGHFKNPTPNAPAVFGESDSGDGVLGLSRAPGRSGVTGFNQGGGRGLTAVGSPAGHFDGDVEVTGDIRLTNQDCAEDFDIVTVKGTEPGTVMVLNETGALEPSSNAYDKKVAGVISGAGDFRPGIILGKQETDSPRMPIALLGKVYCKVDARYSSIEVGDLLTTSPTVGHAMKADDSVRAFGAVIGKALKSLVAGQGLIPILIALQ